MASPRRKNKDEGGSRASTDGRGGSEPAGAAGMQAGTKSAAAASGVVKRLNDGSFQSAPAIPDARAKP